MKTTTIFTTINSILLFHISSILTINAFTSFPFNTHTNTHASARSRLYDHDSHSHSRLLASQSNDWFYRRSFGTSPYNTVLYAEAAKQDQIAAGAPTGEAPAQNTSMTEEQESSSTTNTMVQTETEYDDENDDDDDDEYELVEYETLTESDFLNSEWKIGTNWDNKKNKIDTTWVRLALDQEKNINRAIWGDGAEGTWKLDERAQFLSISKETFGGWGGKKIWAGQVDDYYYVQGTIRGWMPLSPASVLGLWQMIRLGVDKEEAGIAPWFQEEDEQEIQDQGQGQGQGQTETQNE